MASTAPASLAEQRDSNANPVIIASLPGGVAASQTTPLPGPHITPPSSSSSAAAGAVTAARLRRGKKGTTRDKIEKLVTEGTKNYPAYLKLIYTGDSDFSSEDEAAAAIAASDNQKRRKSKSNEDNRNRASSASGSASAEPMDNKTATSMMTSLPGRDDDDLVEDLDLTPPSAQFVGVELDDNRGDPDLSSEDTEKFILDVKQVEKSRSRTSSSDRSTFGNRDDSFYDTIETASPDYDNAAASRDMDPVERARQEEEYRAELAKLEEEISTLRTVLSAKVYQSSELKKKLGITPMVEIKHDLKQGLQNIKESDAYQKTNDKLSQISETVSTSQAYQKTNQAFKSFGQFASKKFGDVRNSNTFKSFEEKVGGAYTNVKSKVRGSQSENNFQDALSTSAASDTEGATSAEVDTTAASTPKSSETEAVPL